MSICQLRARASWIIASRVSVPVGVWVCATELVGAIWNVIVSGSSARAGLPMPIRATAMAMDVGARIDDSPAARNRHLGARQLVAGAVSVRTQRS